jgi:hypothetical protein
LIGILERLTAGIRLRGDLDYILGGVVDRLRGIFERGVVKGLDMFGGGGKRFDW